MQTKKSNSTGTDVILKVKELTKYYKCDDAEDNIINIIGFLKRNKDLGIKAVSFDIYKGRIIGLRGKKKCGKSTLLKLLAGIIKPSSGNIFYMGLKMNSQQLKDIVSYISKEQPSCQEYNCTLFENLIQYTCKEQKERCDVVDKAEKLINDFELQDYKYKEVIKLPSAVRSKMFILRGLLSTKTILCFDHPMMFIEEKLQDTFKKYMNELVQAGKTIIISTDEENILESICNEIITLD